jgi:hypothetical protein
VLPDALARKTRWHLPPATLHTTLPCETLR